MNARFLALAAIILLLSGCNQPANPGTDPGPGGKNTGSQSSTETSGNVPPILANNSYSPLAVWSGCRGFRTSIPGLTNTFTFDPQPPGWESDNPTTEFDLRFYECDRVSWGTFERGPVQMIVEMGGSFQNPPNCNGEAASLLRNMASWWFSDADVAAYARTVYGANAYATNFTVTRLEQAGAVDQTWEWGEPGARSNVRLIDADAPSDPTSHVTRIFWFVGAGVYAMDWTEEWLFPTGSLQNSGFRPTTGRLEDPMLYSSASDFNEFAGRSERYEGMEIAADFYRFGDLACEQPL